MPTYEYECQDCHERLEAVQSFTDAPLSVCPRCGGTLRKVFSSVGIVFKGSGFYKNDSRSSTSTKEATTPKESSSSTSGDSSPTPAATPAAKESTPAPKTVAPKAD
jgi:putative FmdB family regulatory protein